MSFRPYQRPANFTPHVPVFRVAEPAKTAVDVSVIPKIHYMERVLKSGDVAKISVVDENAYRTLLGNGFRRCYTEPGEKDLLETSPEPAAHVICRPSPIAAIVENMSLYEWAKLLQPDDKDILDYRAKREARAAWSATVEHCYNALEAYKAKLPSFQMENDEMPQQATKKAAAKKPRGRFPKKTALKKVDADKNIDELLATSRPSVIVGKFPKH